MLKRQSQLHNKTFRQVFTKEAYNRLKNDESFRLNLETMRIEDIPEEITIPAYDVVIFGTHTIRGEKAVVISDFLSIIFPFDWLDMGYDDLIGKIESEI